MKAFLECGDRMDISQYMIGVMLAFSRVASFLFFVPFLKNNAIPSIAKVSISLAISMAVAGQMSEVVVTTLPSLIGVIVMQILVGITLAFVIEMIVASVSMAGGLIDIDMGFSAVTVIDPSSNQQVTIISNIFTIIFTLIFIQIGGIQFLISGIVYSFKFTTPAFFIGNASFIEMMLAVFSYMMLASVQIALPFTATMFIVNIVLLILGKSAPQMNIFNTMYMIKIAVGLFVLYATLPFLGEVFLQINDGLTEKFAEMMNEIFKK